MSDKVELKLGEGGYQSAPDPRMRGPEIAVDRGRSRADAMCMRAQRLEVVSDGTLAGTKVIIDGVQVVGLIRFELVASKGFPRVTAVATMACEHMNTPMYGENAGKEIKGSNAQATVTADVFRRS